MGISGAPSVWALQGGRVARGLGWCAGWGGGRWLGGICDSGRGRAGLSWVKRTVGGSFMGRWCLVPGCLDRGGHQAAGGPGQSAGLLPSLQGGSVTLPWGLGVADGGSRGWGVLALEQGGLQAGKAQAGPEICFSDAVEPAAEAASQRTRLGHKGRDYSISRQPGLQALPPSLGLRTVKNKRGSSKLLSSDWSQSGLTGTEVRLLQAGQTPGWVDTCRRCPCAQGG